MYTDSKNIIVFSFSFSFSFLCFFFYKLGEGNKTDTLLPFSTLYLPLLIIPPWLRLPVSYF